MMDLEKVINKELERLGYDIEGGKTADFTDGFFSGYNYAQEQVKNHTIPDVVEQSEQLPCDCNVKLAETTLQIYCPKCYKTYKTHKIK